MHSAGKLMLRHQGLLESRLPTPKAKIKFSPVVVFGVLSRMVLVRCSRIMLGNIGYNALSNAPQKAIIIMLQIMLIMLRRIEYKHLNLAALG